MKPKCNSCISFEDRKKEPVVYRCQGLYQVVFEMKLFVFDGHCRLAHGEGGLSRPFFLYLRNKNYTCEKWKWRGKKENEGIKKKEKREIEKAEKKEKEEFPKKGKREIEGEGENGKDKNNRK